VLLHSAVSSAQMSNYWMAIKNLERSLAANEFHAAEVINQDFDASKVPTSNLAVDAAQYFGANNWPNDFLLAFWDARPGGECGPTATAGFYALPRQLFVLVAVVEARSTILEVEGMTYLRDSQVQLRQASEGTQVEAAPPGLISLRRGQSAVIPLRMELQYDLSDEPIRALQSPSAMQYYNRIVDDGAEVFKFDDWVGGVLFTKLKSSFRKPESRKVTPGYVFGPSYTLQDIKLKGKTVPVRKVPPAAIWFARTSAGFISGATCPFLFVDNKISGPSIIGRILVGASSATLTKTETIRLPESTEAFILSELEPEITFIERISIKAEDASNDTVVAENLVIRPGNSVRFEIPRQFREKPILTVRGYYQPLRQREIAAN